MGKSVLSEERVLGSSCSGFIIKVVCQFGVFKDILSWHISNMTAVVMPCARSAEFISPVSVVFRVL